jgi:hypothetical protein
MQERIQGVPATLPENLGRTFPRTPGHTCCVFILFLQMYTCMPLCLAPPCESIHGCACSNLSRSSRPMPATAPASVPAHFLWICLGCQSPNPKTGCRSDFEGRQRELLLDGALSVIWRCQSCVAYYLLIPVRTATCRKLGPSGDVLARTMLANSLRSPIDRFRDVVWKLLSRKEGFRMVLVRAGSH